MGVCVDTGKLISKDRLKAVPHTDAFELRQSCAKTIANWISFIGIFEAIDFLCPTPCHVSEICVKMSQ